MDNFELNKIAGAILFSALVIMIISNIVDVLYNPAEHTVIESQKIEVASSITGQQDIILDIAALMESASAEKGKVAAKKCIACHTFEQGGPNRVGPNLWNIVGNKKAHLGGSFNYSKPMLEKEGSWGYEELFEFLRSPRSYIKGTSMAFAGISKPQEIADVISYLRSMGNNPVPLPKKVE
ncbi:cytochrome c family protein [Candidatus Mesenet endosymbiont of Phosphuga atrata]|uniref:c-type cytochrome n=1 Tax=Candidatus Mesenet endosymbiont of Phosphuga atrata TaxID=3066221 RepID=UPI0030CA5D4E